MDHKEYDRLWSSNTEWFCPTCTWHELPFADTSFPIDAELAELDLSNVGANDNKADSSLTEC